jgi:hypothetical protein
MGRAGEAARWNPGGVTEARRSAIDLASARVGRDADLRCAVPQAAMRLVRFRRPLRGFVRDFASLSHG